MIVLKMECSQCRLRSIGGAKTIAEGCREYVRMDFSLCPDWMAIDDVVANFRAAGAAEPVTVQVIDGSCKVPQEVLVQPYFTVGLMGTCLDGVRIVSTTVLFPVSFGESEVGGSPSDARSIYEVMLAEVEDSCIPVGGTVGQVVRKAESGTEWGDANDHGHDASAITGGVLDAERLPTVPVSHGGTGATTATEALASLGAASEDHTHSTSERIKFTLAGTTGKLRVTFPDDTNQSHMCAFVFSDGNGTPTVGYLGKDGGGVVCGSGTFTQTAFDNDAHCIDFDVDPWAFVTVMSNVKVVSIEKPTS